MPKLGPEAERARLESAYDFLRDRATSGKTFAVQDMVDSTGWEKNSVTTYISKQWYDFLERTGVGEYRVRREFRRMTFDDFLRLASQKRRVYSRYARVEYGVVASYEFLLPLARENELRQSLDDLFYTDTILRRLEELTVPAVETWIPRTTGQSDEDYLASVAQMVGGKFGGYSISHVNGRFRAADLLSRQDASKLIAEDQRYLIDETTAVVRFIIPIQASRSEAKTTSAFDFGVIGSADDIAAELRVIREFFFNLFVETVVRVVEGEDEIWLVEDTGTSRRLYVWEKT